MGMTRRQLVFSGAAATLAGARSNTLVRSVKANPIGANQRLRVAVIGTGFRGKYLIGNLPETARVVAISDCAQWRMDAALQPKPPFDAVLAKFCQADALRCKAYQDYRDLIDRETLDAVIIATPDHHHVQAAVLALDAGLDVYVEKPLTVSIGEGKLLVSHVERTGRVVQVGSQQRTMELNRFACEFIRDGGIGKVTRVDFPNYPGPLPAGELPAEPVPAGLNWNLFLGPTPFRAYNRRRWIKDEFSVGTLLWRGWDLFREYSGHLMTNWGAHSMDMVQYALGMDDSGPVRITPRKDATAEALQQDWREQWSAKTPQPDMPWTAAPHFRPVDLDYANGVTVHLKAGINAAVFYGEHGTMMIRRNQFRCNPPDLVRDPPDPSLARQWQGAGHVARPHLQNWLDCIQTRATPNAPINVGHRTASVCHLVNLARELNRPLQWDPRIELFVDDIEANRLVMRPRREGFRLAGMVGT